MESFLEILMFISILLIMFSMGTGLKLSDFREALSQPKTVIVILFCQIAILPLLAVSIALLLKLDEITALGLLLISVCPGGVASNLFTRLARGDTALSISLTAIHSIIAVVTIPFFTWLGISALETQSSSINVPFQYLFGQLMVVTAIPLAIGMFCRAHFEHFFKHNETNIIRMVTLAFLVVVFFLWASNWEEIWQSLLNAGFATGLLIISAISIGFVISALAKFEYPQKVTAILEIGIQNSAIGFFIAVNVLNNIEYSAATGIYSVFMVTLGLVVVLVSRFYWPKPN